MKRGTSRPPSSWIRDLWFRGTVFRGSFRQSPRPGAQLGWIGVATFALAMLLLPSGASAQSSTPRRTVDKNHSNNLTHVDCAPHDANYSGTTAIQVNDTNAVEENDEAIFVCTGEKVQWVAGSGVKSIVVSFPKAYWPFSDAYVAKLTGDPGHPTDAKTVKALPSGHRMYACKYKVTVTTTAGKTFVIDPHVIPIGP
jgi:hypothetical protein